MNAFKPLAVVLAAALSLPAVAANNLKQISIATFQGTDRNWFNPANWSTGRVPGSDDVVVLDGTDDVVVDPSQSNGRIPGRVNINAIWMTDSARLETLPGTHLVAKLQVTDGQAAFVTRSSIVETEAAVTLDGFNGANPSGWYRKQPWVVLGGTMYFGLGGREPAGIQKVGAGQLDLIGYGYYANVNASALVLGGTEGMSARFRAAGRLLGIKSVNATFHRLFGDSNGDKATVQERQMTVIQDMVDEAATQLFRLYGDVNGDSSTPSASKPDQRISARIDKLPKMVVALHYDFKPAVGDTFQIITADTLVGEFDGLPEGALVGCTEDDSVGLWISYRGGDGNDVVLSAGPGTPDVCATKEHILLARQVGVPSL